MHFSALALGIFTLLILPGPTNAILAMASQGLTLARAIALLTAVLCSYLAVIIPVSSLSAPLLHGHPIIAQTVKLISATWVLYLAVKLWSSAPKSQGGMVRVPHLIITTLLNPKAIIIGLTMIVSDDGSFPIAALVTFSIAVIATSTVWLLAGRLILGGKGQTPVIARRCGSVVLLAFSALLTISALQ